MVLAQKIRAHFTGGNLFYTTGIFTLIYWAILITQFIAGENVALVPNIMDELYLTTLAAYVGVNQAEKVRKDERKKRKGQVFFYGWIALTAIGLVLVAFQIHGNEEILDNIWPLPLGPIIGIFGGTQLIKAVKGALDSSNDKVPDEPNPDE